MRRVTLTAIVTAAALLPLPSWAMAPPRAGVLPLDVQGKLPPTGPAGFSEKIGEGLTSAGVTVVSADELGKAAGGALDSCTDETCLRELSTKASTTRLVRPSVRLDQSDYVIGLEVIDGATGRVVHQASQTCELCGLVEALEMAATLAASLEPHLAAATGTVAVTSTPAGAQVLVDGEPAGVTPLELALPVGAHTIVLREEGRADVTHRVTVEVGATAAVTADLGPTAPADDAPRRELSPMLRPIGWAAIGVGVASVGSGIALLVLDERPVEYTRCSGIDVDIEGNCRFRHNTLAGGVVMMIVGVVGVTAGALLVARTKGDRGKGSSRHARLQPTSRGIAIRF